MKIAVVGAGAMGSIFGSRLTEAGHKTVLVDVSEPLVERLNADGVTIVRGDHERTTAVTATADPSALGAMDAVVFFVKCYHTRSAAELARPLVASNTVVASLQNGWGNGDVLAGVYPAAQIVVGVTYNSGLVHGPGRVVHPAEQPTIVGSFVPDGALDGAARLAHALADAGFEASVASPVQPEIWKKLILNAASLPTSALTGMNAGALTDCEETHALASDVAVESVAVARALGFDVDPDERVRALHALAQKAGPTKASMLQDFEAGRRTEIDVINGAIVKAADGLGVGVPLNRALVQLVQGWESMRGLV